jgi:hypothetical protein
MKRIDLSPISGFNPRRNVFLMAPPPKNSIITITLILTQILTQTLTLILTLALTLYGQNHILIIEYTNSINFWVGVP